MSNKIKTENEQAASSAVETIVMLLIYRLKALLFRLWYSLKNWDYITVETDCGKIFCVVWSDDTDVSYKFYGVDSKGIEDLNTDLSIGTRSHITCDYEIKRFFSGGYKLEA